MGWRSPARSRSCHFPSLEAPPAAPIASVSRGQQCHPTGIPATLGVSACPCLACKSLERQVLPAEPGQVTGAPREQRDSPAPGSPTPGRGAGAAGAHRSSWGCSCSSPGTAVTQSLPPCLLSSLTAVPICLLHASSHPSHPKQWEFSLLFWWDMYLFNYLI